jgi:hypothetical protein
MFDSNSGRNKTMVTGLFPDRASAEQAFDSVSARGYSKDDINLVMSDEARQQHFAHDGITETELGTKAAQGAGIGGAIGGSLGAIVAAIAAVGTSIAIPGAGLIIAGPIVAALAGAGAGGATGGLIGALIGYGIPEERIAHYEDGIKRGGILMGVTPRSEEDALHFETTFKEHKGEHVIGTGIGAGAGALTGAAIGAVAGPVGMVAGAAVGAITGGLAGKGAAVVVNPDAGDKLENHHLATGTGAGGGAIAGAAVGAIGGPIGMAVGAAVGAVAGGAVGKGAAKMVNPAEEDAYWRGSYVNESYVKPDTSYDDYAPAYRLGYTSYDTHRGDFAAAEPTLASQWDLVKGNSRLTWLEARDASRAAWHRVG